MQSSNLKKSTFNGIRPSFVILVLFPIILTCFTSPAEPASNKQACKETTDCDPNKFLQCKAGAGDPNTLLCLCKSKTVWQPAYKECRVTPQGPCNPDAENDLDEPLCMDGFDCGKTGGKTLCVQRRGAMKVNVRSPTASHKKALEDSPTSSGILAAGWDLNTTPLPQYTFTGTASGIDDNRSENPTHNGEYTTEGYIGAPKSAEPQKMDHQYTSAIPTYNGEYTTEGYIGAPKSAEPQKMDHQYTSAIPTYNGEHTTEGYIGAPNMPETTFSV